MRIKNSTTVGTSLFLAFIVLSSVVSAHHFGEVISKSTPNGTDYTITVLVDSINTEINANFTVFIEILFDQFGQDTIGISNIKLLARLEGGAFFDTDNRVTSDVEFEKTGSNAGFIFNISSTVSVEFDVSGRAEFYENLTGSDVGVYTDSDWFKAHTITVGIEQTNFGSLLIVASTIFIVTQVWRFYRKNKRAS